MADNINIAKRITVGIGCVCVQATPSEMVSYAIGSCIALCLYESEAEIGAMAHILLPSNSYMGREDTAAKENTKYADHALDIALNKMIELGADKARIKAAIVGGATMFAHGDIKTLNIGEMNTASVTRELKLQHIPLIYSVTGGKKSRTVTFRIPGKSMEDQILLGKTTGFVNAY